MEVDRSQNIRDLWSGDVELSEEFNLPTSNLWINPELSRHRHKILLENLKGDNSGACPAMGRHEINGDPLLGGRRFVVGVDQNIRVKETTSAHESRRS